MDRFVAFSQVDPDTFHRRWIEPLLAAGASFEVAIASIANSHFSRTDGWLCLIEWSSCIPIRKDGQRTLTPNSRVPLCVSVVGAVILVTKSACPRANARLLWRND